MHIWFVGICDRLQNIPLVVWLVTAQYAYPFIQWTHFTGLSLWLGTTLALSHLIFEGTFDRFPGLKVIAAHGGGYLPSYANRSDHACLVGPKGCNPAVVLKKKPTEYLKQIYFDSLVFSPEAIRHLAAQVGAGQIVLGSDYPYPWQLNPVDHIFDSTSLSDDEKADILGRTAERLFNLEAQTVGQAR